MLILPNLNFKPIGIPPPTMPPLRFTQVVNPLEEHVEVVTNASRTPLCCWWLLCYMCAALCYAWRTRAPYISITITAPPTHAVSQRRRSQTGNFDDELLSLAMLLAILPLEDHTFGPRRVGPPSGGSNCGGEHAQTEI